MKPSQLWWLQVVTVALLVAFVLFPHREGLQAFLLVLIVVTNIFNRAMDRPQTDRQRLTSDGISFILNVTIIPFAWGKPMGWFVLAVFPLTLLTFVMSVRRIQAIQTSLPN